jgi:RNA polymerase nonessential primary-like sigma factor
MTQAPTKSRRSIAERNALVEQWIGLASFVARRISVSRLTPDEMLRAGEDGLLRAAELWDETRGVRFNTYAYRCIHHAIWKANRMALLIHVPENMQRVGKLCPGWAATRERHGEAARRAMRVGRLRCEPKAQPPGGNEDEWGVREPASPEPLRDDVDADDLADLEAAMAKLTEKQRDVLRMRVWQEMTLAQTGEAMGLTRERVRQIQKEAVKRLRELMQ